MRNKELAIIEGQKGIALVTAMIITLVVLMMITGITYMLTRGFGANVLNREFSTAYDAANGGVEFGAGLISSYIDTGTITNLVGDATIENNLSNLIQSCAAGPQNISLTTSDNKYSIVISISCVGSQPIPGQGGVQAFPPLPAITSGGGGTWYLFYAVNATATETATGTVGRTESVYRAIM